MGNEATVGWMRPPKLENISVGRHQVAKHLRDRGFDIDILDATRETAQAVLRNRDYDILIGTTRAGALIGATAKLVTGTPMIVDHIDPIRQFHESDPWWLSVPVHVGESLSFAIADHVCYTTLEDESRVNRWARRADRTTLGVEYERFANPPKDIVQAADHALREYDLRQHAAIYIGGLEPNYHIHELLTAIERLPEWSLIVLGDGSLSPEVRAAEQTIYLETVPYEAVPGYLQMADVGVSLIDERTCKVIEYAAAGLPIVHQQGRVADRFGELVRPTDCSPTSIGDALDDASCWPWERVSEMQAWAEGRDWGAVADIYESAIGEVLDGQ